MSSPSPHSVQPLHLKEVPLERAQTSALTGNAAARATMPGTVRGKRAATRDRLMDACSNLIVRDGFRGVSMTSVAEEARITRQTVYRYFPNAGEVVRATLMRGGRELLEGQLLVFADGGRPQDLLVESVMTALRLIDRNPLLRAAWVSRESPQTMLRLTVDPSFSERAVAGLRPIAEQLDWSEQDTREAYEIIARTVMSFMTIPPSPPLTEDQIRRALHRRLIPALGA
jgi:AcrR family transcriptional regulator